MERRSLDSMEGYSRKPRRDEVRREIWQVQGRSRRKDRKKGKASTKKQGGIGETLKRYTVGEAKGQE